jgi:hypothetical protein
MSHPTTQSQENQDNRWAELSLSFWRLFMSGAAHQSESCETNVYQALFVKPHQGKSGFPLTRNDWYQ